jgi:hypothetical protein
MNSASEVAGGLVGYKMLSTEEYGYNISGISDKLRPSYKSLRRKLQEEDFINQNFFLHFRPVLSIHLFFLYLMSRMSLALSLPCRARSCVWIKRIASPLT